MMGKFVVELVPSLFVLLALKLPVLSAAYQLALEDFLMNGPLHFSTSDGLVVLFLFLMQVL